MKTLKTRYSHISINEINPWAKHIKILRNQMKLFRRLNTKESNSTISCTSNKLKIHSFPLKTNKNIPP